MTRKHYREVAEAFRRATHDAYPDTHTQMVVAELARDLADLFKRDNSSFRYDTFFEACGLNEWGKPND